MKISAITDVNRRKAVIGVNDDRCESFGESTGQLANGG